MEFRKVNGQCLSVGRDRELAQRPERVRRARERAAGQVRTRFVDISHGRAVGGGRPGNCGQLIGTAGLG